jgi:hypothetical protein
MEVFMSTDSIIPNVSQTAATQPAQPAQQAVPKTAEGQLSTEELMKGATNVLEDTFNPHREIEDLAQHFFSNFGGMEFRIREEKSNFFAELFSKIGNFFAGKGFHTSDEIETRERDATFHGMINDLRSHIARQSTKKSDATNKTTVLPSRTQEGQQPAEGPKPLYPDSPFSTADFTDEPTAQPKTQEGQQPTEGPKPLYPNSPFSTADFTDEPKADSKK